MGGVEKEVAIEMNREYVEFVRRKKRSAKSYGKRSMCCLSTTNKFRTFFMDLSNNRYFNSFIIVAILVNSVALALEEPPKLGEKHSKEQEMMEIVFIAIFSVEMFIKIIAMGFVMHDDSYLHDPWNILDFLVVLSSWVNISQD